MFNIQHYKIDLEVNTLYIFTLSRALVAMVYFFKAKQQAHFLVLVGVLPG